MGEAAQFQEPPGDEQGQLESFGGESNKLGVRQSIEWLGVRYLPAGADGNASGAACEEALATSDNDLGYFKGTPA